MFLVVGLGNPGSEHAADRHNVGFMVIEQLSGKLGFPPPRRKFGGMLALGKRRALPVALLQPMTFMNRSGESVQPAAAYHRVSPEDVVVAHDELDLPWGQVRLKLGGGHAGHNGIRSVIERLGTDGFVRVRVGIGKPPAQFGGSVAGWVLSPFTASERVDLPKVIEAASVAVVRVLDDGAAAAMNVVNARRE